MVVPDWVDPAEPAVVETSCTEESFDGDEVVATSVDYEPVAFDIEPGSGPSVTQRSFSRTSLLAGQGLRVDATGCTLPGAEYGGVGIFTGGDLNPDFTDLAASGDDAEIGEQAFEAEVILTGQRGFNTTVSEGGDGPPEIESVEELNTPLAPGSYTALTFCVNDEAALLYEPQVIEVTGVAPVDRIDLTVEEGTDRVTLAGSACPAATVEVNLEATSFGDQFGDFSDRETGSGTEARRGSAGSTMMAPGPSVPESGRRDGSDSAQSDAAPGAEARGAAGGLADDGFLDATVDTDADGGWSITESAGFERGIVEGRATCGDPFADGFVYDDQIVEVDAATAEPPTSEPTTTLPAGPVVTNPVPTTPGVVVAMPAAPANAVAGRPTYTG